MVYVSLCECPCSSNTFQKFSSLNFFLFFILLVCSSKVNDRDSIGENYLLSEHGIICCWFCCSGNAFLFNFYLFFLTFFFFWCWSGFLLSFSPWDFGIGTWIETELQIWSIILGVGMETCFKCRLISIRVLLQLSSVKLSQCSAIKSRPRTVIWSCGRLHFHFQCSDGGTDMEPCHRMQ